MADATAAATTRRPDILVRTAPPLSAISDMPLSPVERPPPSASNDKADIDAGTAPPEMTAQEQAAARAAAIGKDAPKVETKPAEPEPEPKAEPKAETKATNPDAADLPKDMPGWAVREITKARQKAREEIAKAAEQQNTALEDLKRQLEELKSAKPTEPAAETPPAQSAKPKPQRDQFDSPEAYDTALETWGIEEGQRIAAEKAAAEQAEADRQAKDREAQDAKRKQEEETQALNDTWNVRKAEFAEAHEDYETVVSNPELNIPLAAAHAIMLDDNGPAIAYHLGKNPELADKIAALPPQKQFIEIGKLSAQLTAPPIPETPRRPRTPRPIEPIDGGNAPADTSEREPSMEEYAARRSAQLYAGRRPLITGDMGLQRTH